MAKTRSGKSSDTNASSASRCHDDDPDGLEEYEDPEDSDATEDQESPKKSGDKPQPKKRQGKPKRDSDDDKSSDEEYVKERKKVIEKRNAARTTSKPAPPKSRGKPNDSLKHKSKTGGTVKKGGKGQNSDLTNPVSDGFRKDKELRRAANATDMQKSGANAKQAEADKSIAEQFAEYKRVARARILEDEAKINDLLDEKADLMDREDKLLEERDQMEEVLNKSGNGSDYEPEEDNEQVKSSEHSIIKNATKLVYRTVKFINNEEQQRQFGEMVMDKTQLAHLQFSDKDTALKSAEVRKSRASFRKKWEKTWLRIVNEQRNYNQVRTSDIMSKF